MYIWIIIFLRLLIPLTIFKSPFLGGLASLVIDYFDMDLMRYFGVEVSETYQTLDKILDIYYLSFEFLMISTWKDYFVKNIAKFLFLYRMVGVIIFEATKIEKTLFFFPNLFENFFLLYFGLIFFLEKEPVILKKKIIIMLSILLILKLYQEFFLHFVNVQPWPGSGDFLEVR